MNFEDQYQNVYQFFGYFHQDWMDVFKWEGRSPSFESVIRKYKTESGSVNKTIFELKTILQKGKEFEYDDWVELLTYKLGLNFRPKAFGLTHQEWLIETINILEEPMSKTLEHWIPKRIRE